MRKNSRKYFFPVVDLHLAVDRSVLTDVVFRKMKLLSDFQSIVNGVFRIFVIQRLMSSFLWNCFYCSTVDCLHFPARVWEWE